MISKPKRTYQTVEIALMGDNFILRTALRPNLFFTLFLSMCLSALGQTLSENKSASGRPNIILLMADDLGWGDVGFNGNEAIITPNLDDMAQGGVRFTNFYAAAPLCSPTRASVLTGRDPFRQGILAAHTGGMRIGEKTIAEYLKEEGYRTGFFGKWHLGWLEPDRVQSRGHYSPPEHHGYDESFATKSAVPTWNPTKTPEGWTSWGAMEDGSWGGSRYLENGVVVTENLDGDDSRIIMDRAIPFIEEAIQDQMPFFTTIWFHTPHEPVVAGPEYLAKYPGLPEEQKHLYGCITAMDEQIGRLRSFLKELEIEENTIVFFCSDNGPDSKLTKKGIASAGPFRGHKHQMWDGGIKVPSLIEWPGQIEAGQTSEFRASTNDYLPTILEIVGLEAVEGIPIDGVSLIPILDGAKDSRTKPIAAGYQRLYRDQELYALIHENFKICIPKKGESMKLYDLAQDPNETTDLAASLPERLEEMKKLLDQIKESWKASREGADYEW